MKTITLQMSNSDNKLTQQVWSSFVNQMKQLLDAETKEVHFFGGSENWQPWQNVVFIFSCEASALARLKQQVTALRRKHQQDSVAWTQGTPRFI
jgi:hypothetical protein